MKMRYLIVVSLIAVFSFVGCSNSTSSSGPEPLSHQAGRLDDHDGENKTVSKENQNEFMVELGQNIYRGALYNYRNKNYDFQYDTTIVLDTTVKGLNSGEIAMTGTIRLKMSSKEKEMTMNGRSVYYNFSNDGELYLGGEQKLKFTMYEEESDNGDIEKMTTDLRGAFRFNGSYEGTMDYEMSMTVDGEKISGKVYAVIESGGETIIIDESIDHDDNFLK